MTASRRIALILSALVLAPLARSGGIYPPLLPPEQQVMAAMMAAPELVAAHEQIGEGGIKNPFRRYAGIGAGQDRRPGLLAVA